MRSLSVNRVSGLSLMVGVLVSLVLGVVTTVIIRDDSGEGGSFFEQRLRPWADNDGLMHVATMLTILGAVLISFGLYHLLRIPRRPGVSDMALRFGAAGAILSWVIVIIAMGVRHMIVHTLTHGLTPEMAEVERMDVGLILYAANTGVLFGSLSLYALSNLLLGGALAVRFRELMHIRVAGYGLVAMGLASVVNLTLIEHLHDVDFGVLAILMTVVVLLGNLWLLVLGFGIYRGDGEFGDEVV